jgi:hypothetical protein
MDLANECGIVPPDMQEALPSDKKSFADLLNDNPYTSDDADLRAEVTRDIMCDYLRPPYAWCSRRLMARTSRMAPRRKP